MKKLFQLPTFRRWLLSIGAMCGIIYFTPQIKAFTDGFKAPAAKHTTKPDSIIWVVDHSEIK